MRPHVFELFAQDGPERKLAQECLGIGLAFARDLIEMHNGSIHVATDEFGALNWQ